MGPSTIAAIHSANDTMVAAGEGVATWREAAAHAAKLMHADSACILWRDKHSREVIAAEFVDVPETALAAYNSYYADRDCLARKLSHTPAGTRFVTNKVVSQHELDDHEFVFDFLHPHGVQDLQGFVIYSDSHYVVSISFLRDQILQQTADITLREKSLFFSIHQAFSSYSKRSQTELHHIATLLQPQTHCWLVVNEAGKLLQDSKRSFEQLNHGGSLHIHQQQLCHRLQTWQERLQSSMTSVLKTGLTELLLIPDDWGRSYRLHISVAPERYSYGFRQLLLLRLECRSVFEVPSAEVLREFFMLTPTEAQICHYVVAGLTLKDVAEVLNIAPETARKHLASIFKKTDCSRQSELQRLVASL